MLAALAAFAIGLRQYHTAQQWKRKEFVAAEMKEFFTDWRVANALLMIDWGNRWVALATPAANQAAQQVTRALQISALRPHMLLSQESDAESTTDGGFTPTEAAIRDTYDRLLDWFDRFGAYLDSKLVATADLQPYLAYWIKDIASTDASELDLQWTLALLTYIHFYEFSQTIRLFFQFGEDISIDGPIWNALQHKIQSEKFLESLEPALKYIQSRSRLQEEGART
jgi:hypothetical protein